MVRSAGGRLRRRSFVTLDASATRRANLQALVRQVVVLADGDAGAFYEIGEASDGSVVRHSPVLVTDGLAALEEAAGILFRSAPDRAITGCLVDPRRATAREARHFMESSALWGSYEAFAQRPLSQWLSGRFGIGDQIRLVAFQGDICIGWLGTFRRTGARPFGVRDRRRLAGLVAPVLASLASLHALEVADRASGGVGYLIVSPDGRVLHASAAGEAWLATPGFRDALTASVRDADTSDSGHLRGPLGCAQADIVRLDGDGGVRYLVSVVRPQRLRRSPFDLLSPTQREIGELVAAGVERAEIARALAMSPETVKSHLRAIYQRLDVANRLELGRLFAAHAKERDPSGDRPRAR